MPKKLLPLMYEDEMQKLAQRPSWLPATEYTPTTVGKRPTFLPVTEHTENPEASTETGTKADETPSPAYVSSNDAVKQMQSAIIAFGRALAAHPVMSGGGQQERPGTKPDFLGGSTPFGNFLVNQYVNNAKVVGEQFVNIDLPQPLRSATSIPNVNLAGVISTIMRVGIPGAEHKPDGIWQARTNNALRQIYAVGKALMQMAHDMKVSIGGFGEKTLDKMATLIPNSYTELKDDVTDRATELTQIITNLTDLYQKFETVVLDDPELKPLIEQEKALADHSQDHLTPHTPEEDALLNAHRDMVVPGLSVAGKPVRLADLEGMTAFKTLLQNAKIDISHPGNLQHQITMLQSALTGNDLGPGF